MKNRVVFWLTLIALALGIVVLLLFPTPTAAAYLACNATGNLTVNTTWNLISSWSETESGTTALTGSGTWDRSTTTFAPGAVICDGIGIKLAQRAASPTGTIAVRLYNSSDSLVVAGTTTTINAADLPTCVSSTTNEGGWIFFKWSAPVTLTAGKNYLIEVAQSAATANMIYLWRIDGTARNWARFLRTTTIQAPAAGDVMVITKEWTAAGTGTTFVVTMNQTASTDYGAGTDNLPAMIVGQGCTLNYGYAAATNYYLKLSGNLIVYNTGTFTIGTVANPIPRDGSAVLEFDPVADGGMGLIARDGSTFTAQGLSRSSGKDIYKCKLNTDEAVGQTTLGVDADTGWLSGDAIGIATTTQTYSQCETRTLNAGAGASSVTVGSGLTNAHSGTSPTQAEVILLTRDVRIRSASSTLMTFVSIKSTATVDLDWVEFYYMGENAAGKKSIEVETTTGSFNMQYSSIWNTEDWGFCTTGTTTNNIVFSNNVMYNVATAVTNPVYVVATSGTTVTLDNNVVMLTALASSVGFNILDTGLTFTNNTVCGINGVGVQFGEANATTGTFSGNTAHGNASYGITLNNSNYNSTFETITVWRNAGRGLYISSLLRNCTISSLVAFGNSTANVYLLYGAGLTFSSPDLDGDTTFATTNGIEFPAGALVTDVRITSGNLGVAGGIKATHTNDINVAGITYAQIYLFDTVLGSGVECLNYANLIAGSFIKSDNNDNLGTTDRVWKRGGVEENETTIFKTAAPSLEQIPASTSVVLTGDKWYIPCDSGELVTVTIWSRWDSSNTPGTRPTVTLEGCGITPSTSTNSSATTVWQQLTVSGTPTSKGLLTLTPTCYKSSSATSVYWDDIATTYAGGGSKSLGGLDYWFQALPQYFGKVITNVNNLIRSWGTIVGM